MTSRRRASAFTLIELVLVLALIAMLLAAAAPRFSGFGRGQRLDNAVESFLAAARHARGQAIATAMPHRLEVDAGRGVYWVSRFEGQSFVPVAGEWGRETTLPEDVDIAIERFDESNSPALDYAANGSGTPVTVVFTSAWGRVVELSATGLADPLRRVRQDGGS